MVKTATAVPRGKPKSGRSWKSVATKRSTVHSGDRKNPLSKTWEQKVKERADRKRLLERVAEVKEKQLQERLRAKEKREEKIKRKAANTFKSSTYQVLKNPEKMKLMNKKQLRKIKKTRIGKHGEVELVPAYQK